MVIVSLSWFAFGSVGFIMYAVRSSVLNSSSGDSDVKIDNQ